MSKHVKKVAHMQQEDKDIQRLIQAPMSDIWRELLGNSHSDTTSTDGEVTLPTLKSDPWGELLQSRGVEMIDSQQVHLHMSDQDVELALQIMQEQPLQNISREQDSTL
jgi:hypothetical protein